MLRAKLGFSSSNAMKLGHGLLGATLAGNMVDCGSGSDNICSLRFFPSLVLWHYTAVILTVGWLKNPEIAVDAISSGVQVSSELGGGNPKAAKFSVAVTF